MADFTLPELGENVTAGDVLRVLVKPGDVLTKEQPVLELETDKATIEVPSSVAGRVTAVKVKAGDKVKVGQVVLSVEENGAPAAAEPSVRRLARELGVDVNEVPGSGADGRLSLEDVKAHAKRLIEGGSAGGTAQRDVPLPDFSRWGAIERQPMRAVRRKTAEHLSAAWQSVPHVTQCDVADVTGLEELRKKYSKQVEAAGGNLTVTAVAVKVIASALKVFPQFNASLDPEAGEIVTKKYVNIGVAVDTDRGLL